MTHVCIKCSKEFRSNYHLERHYNKQIPCGEILKCERCNKIFTIKRDLTLHMNRKKPCNIAHIKSKLELKLEIEELKISRIKLEKEIDKKSKIEILKIKNKLEKEIIKEKKEIKIAQKDKELEIIKRKEEKELEIIKRKEEKELEIIQEKNKKESAQKEKQNELEEKRNNRILECIQENAKHKLERIHANERLRIKLRELMENFINKTELKMRSYLMDKFSNIKYQVKFDWCMNIRHLPFDFLLEDHKIIIELDGDQHFKDIDYFDSLAEDVIKRDKYKAQCAIDNGYKILRIYQPDVYKDTFDWKFQLESYISNCEDWEMVFISKSLDQYNNHKITYEDNEDNEEQEQEIIL